MSQITNFLNQYLLYVLVVFFVLDALLAVMIFGVKKNFKKIFKGGDTDMEKVLLELRQNEIAFGEALKEAMKRVERLEGELPKDLRRVGLVRYNPFSGTGAGGDQSFVLALLNESNDGVVVSSLYGREMNRVYAKLIKNGKSTYQLTAEETQAIAEAK
ncbi:MAG: DUF4446 family protein [bacterium]|nr:DUF4446 family protein [bacterium]